jgi:hypothetical protein
MKKDEMEQSEIQKNDTMKNEDEEIEVYGDQYIASKNAPVPRWLKINYFFWIAFGIVWFYFFWNGSYGWLDRGYWQQLQRAANTTFPFNTTKVIEKEGRETRK